MLIILTIFLLFFIPLAMLIFHIIWPKFSIQGFLSVLAVIAGWLITYFARSNIPHSITLLNWQPAFYFPNSPSILIDKSSWFFSISIISLALISILSSIAHLGQSLKSELNQVKKQINVIEVPNQTDVVNSSSKHNPLDDNKNTTNWQSWAGILVITGFGLVAVTAGNVLTLLLAWAGLDLITLVILIAQTQQTKLHTRTILVFSARMAGVGIVLFASVLLWSKGASLNINEVGQTTSIYLILAAVVRLGVLPLQHPFIHQPDQRLELWTTLLLVPVAASLILLVRVATFGVSGPASLFLLALIEIAGIYAGIQWMTAKDVINGQAYWVLGTAAMAIASAILGHPTACTAWSIACLLSGGLLFSTSIRHKNLLPVIVLGVVGFSTLPFSPTWLGTEIYEFPESITSPISPILLFLLFCGLLLTHSLLLVGFFRFILRIISPTEEQVKIHIEPWVWLIYPFGLVVIVVTHYLIGTLLYPPIDQISLAGWIMGFIAVSLSGVIWYSTIRYGKYFHHNDQPIISSSFTKLMTLEWLFTLFWSVFRSLTGFASIISAILEGDGGILWAFVLFALIFVFLLR
jgi:hypothetical protein